MGLADLLQKGGTSEVLQHVGGMVTDSKSYHSVTGNHCIWPDLYTLAQVADSTAGHNLHRVVQQEVQRVRLLHSLRLLLY